MSTRKTCMWTFPLATVDSSPWHPTNVSFSRCHASILPPNIMSRVNNTLTTNTVDEEEVPTDDLSNDWGVNILPCFPLVDEEVDRSTFCRYVKTVVGFNFVRTCISGSDANLVAISLCTNGNISRCLFPGP